MNLEGDKKELAYFMRTLCRKGLTTVSGGNISVRKGDLMLISPSATDKSRMRAAEILVMDFSGKVRHGSLPPSIEYSMHLSIYRSRPDIAAIVHAHPVNACAISASGNNIAIDLIAETYAVLGKIAYAPNHLMGGSKLAASVAKASESSDCIVMRNHGIIALGKNLLQAFDRIEVAENAAKITLIHMGALRGCKRKLSPKKLREIDVMMKRSPA